MKTSHFAVLTIMFAAAAMQACARDTFPTSPNSGSRVPNVDLSQLRIAGTVIDDEGLPVSGVSVKLYRQSANPEIISTVSDRAGTFSATFVSSPGLSAFTEKDGYRSEWHSLDTSRGGDFQWNLQIHRK